MQERHEEIPERGAAPGAAPARGDAVDAPDARLEARQMVARARAALGASHDLHARHVASLTRAVALAEQSDATRQQSVALRAQLRASLTTLVQSLRAEGVVPERMLVQVKAAMRDAMPPELDARDAQALLEDAVRWSIDAYYRAA